MRPFCGWGNGSALCSRQLPHTLSWHRRCVGDLTVVRGAAVGAGCHECRVGVAEAPVGRSVGHFACVCRYVHCHAIAGGGIEGLGKVAWSLVAVISDQEMKSGFEPPLVSGPMVEAIKVI